MKYLSKISMNNNLITIIFILIILIFFYLINNYLKIEHFLTYFQPFQSNETSLLNKFYNNKDYNKNYFKHKFDYNEIFMYSSNNGYIFFKEYSKRLIEKSKIVKSNLVQLNKA